MELSLWGFFWTPELLFFYMFFGFLIGKRKAETGCMFHCPGLGPFLSSGIMPKGLDSISFEQIQSTVPN